MAEKIRIDAYAGYPHYYEHLWPIWEALDADGEFYVRPSTQRQGTTTRGLVASDVPLLVAGYPDLRRTRRPAVFVEHGAGENYNLTDPHYSGGANRDRVILFLCPNRRVAEANGRDSAVVGSPRVEWLSARLDKETQRGNRNGRPLRVVVSFHWNCTLHPQTRSAFPHYQPYLKSWAEDPTIELAGHAHPRFNIERLYAAAGIPFIPNFEDAIRWADVYAVDNSSTLFEAAALGKDVVVLDAPWYTPEETGFRFWKYADIGPRIQSGADFVDACAKSHSCDYDAIRGQAVTEIFGTVDGSTNKAVDAIRTVLNDNSRSSGSTFTSDTRTFPTQSSLFG